MDAADHLFKTFLAGIFAVLLLYGAGMTGVILFGDAILAAKMLNIFGGMFGGVLGLGTGYLIGRASGAAERNEQP